MDGPKSSAADLNKRIDELCNAMEATFTEVIRRAGEAEDFDYDSTSQNELAMMQAGGAFKSAVQDTSSLIRELQELWLFGGLDTIADPADDAANKDKALEMAALIEKLAKHKMSLKKEEDGGEKNGET
ncbi:hypothetical protein EJ04DRAFT_563905 [Polyplosphaeria fusca]|uniref:Mediator of RNA polymerase II transcription subunit 22 n=1 Tax=Polyplosphaeria fusca TaxID=682080 RepID=A0A9P4V2Y8_9PLEO|nr:hypothetical protein EJ04DRAFT_563905 [Polyplosphaeria fusca]